MRNVRSASPAQLPGALSSSSHVETLLPASFGALVPAAWKAVLGGELDKPYFQALEAFVASERATAKVFPAPEQTFAALQHTSPDAVRVVVTGQDPYPTAGNANGLAFSVGPGVRIPGSLRNIFKVLEKDVGAAVPTHGNLEQWARQGVLLLNTVLTVREGEANSHKGRGWEVFTEAVLKTINDGPQPVVFLLLGAHAQRMAGTINQTRHSIVQAPHPSPLNTARFLASRPFSAVNAALAAHGRGQIDWQIR